MMPMSDSSVNEPIPTLVITGPVGVGKTTVAGAIADQLADAGRANGLIDLDALRWVYPRPADDPFHVALGLRNLAAVAANYRQAGAACLILVDVLEARAHLAGYREAIPGAAIQVVRLHAAPATIAARITGREAAGASHDWHQQRAVELATLFARERPEDLLIDTDGKSPPTVAAEILTQSGWLTE
jgi:adenylylsulfate kinase